MDGSPEVQIATGTGPAGEAGTAALSYKLLIIC
jgi:hypothetical protein